MGVYQSAAYKRMRSESAFLGPEQGMGVGYRVRRAGGNHHVPSWKPQRGHRGGRLSGQEDLAALGAAPGTGGGASSRGSGIHAGPLFMKLLNQRMRSENLGQLGRPGEDGRSAEDPGSRGKRLATRSWGKEKAPENGDVHAMFCTLW